MNELIEVNEEQAITPAVELLRKAADLASQARSAATRRAYGTDWRLFQEWCRTMGVQALPASPETVALWVAAVAESTKVSSVRRKLTAISQAHKLAKLPNPVSSAEVRETVAGLARLKGIAPSTKASLSTNELRAMLTTFGRDHAGLRNRALLLLGFFGAFRRSELVAIDLADVEFVSEGMVITLRRSKTDQEGAGRGVGIPYRNRPEHCPVIALRAWLDTSGIQEGAVFRRIDRYGNVGGKALSAQSVALILKEAAERIGIDSSRYAGHSLRSGFCTVAASLDVPERLIMEQTGHRSEHMVRRYIREGSLFRKNAADAIEL